jgi:hypothetical protein
MVGAGSGEEKRVDRKVRSINIAVTSFLYTPPTINPLPCGAWVEWVRIMLRLKILVSAVPLLAVAIFARIEMSSKTGPCIAINDETVQIASAPWHADLHVAFTDDPALATVRVAITDDAEAADFAVVDDAGDSEGSSCEVTPATQFIAISAQPAASEPVIYLSHDDGPVDYRVFVHARRFSERDAAALIVGSHGLPPRLALNAS